jgi:hypothetical protein
MVSTKTRQIIWGKGAGRCYFCNTSIIGDLISGNEDANFGFIAHIVGEKPNAHAVTECARRCLWTIIGT